MDKDLAEMKLSAAQNMIYCLRTEDIITEDTFNSLNQKILYVADLIRALPDQQE